MTETGLEDWYSLLQSEILDRAYSSHGELAWKRSDALQVANLLQDRGYKIFGIDTWLPTRPGPTPLIEDWDNRNAISAIDFIRTFKRKEPELGPPGLETYFAIIAERDTRTET